jgi:hypothetical protein
MDYKTLKKRIKNGEWDDEIKKAFLMFVIHSLTNIFTVLTMFLIIAIGYILLSAVGHFGIINVLGAIGAIGLVILFFGGKSK